MLESSDNHPMFSENHPIPRPGLHGRQSGSFAHVFASCRPYANRQLIVNRFPVIVNPAALNPSRIYQSRAPIHQFASKSSTLRNRIRNRPAKLAGENIRNYPQPAWPESATAGIYQLARRQPGVQILESSDNHPINLGNHPTKSLNRPIIDRRNRGIDRFPAEQRVPNFP
jgi:hypothetical protein